MVLLRCEDEGFRVFRVCVVGLGDPGFQGLWAWVQGFR